MDSRKLRVILTLLALGLLMVGMFDKGGVSVTQQGIISMPTYAPFDGFNGGKSRGRGGGSSW